MLYQGRIDDQFGIGYRRPGKPTRRDLAEAIDEVLAGKAVSKPKTEVAGCFISRVREPKREGAITFTKHVSRILQKNCQECHRPGQIGPMALLSYGDAVAWAETIREVIDENRMPPWHADPRFGKWSNERRLTVEERKTLLAWLDNGTPRGDDKDLPGERTYPIGWQIGKPDMIIKLPRPFTVPAETPKGGVPYKYFTVPTNFTEDRWVVRAEARPGRRKSCITSLSSSCRPARCFVPTARETCCAEWPPATCRSCWSPASPRRSPPAPGCCFRCTTRPTARNRSTNPRSV